MSLQDIESGKHSTTPLLRELAQNLYLGMVLKSTLAHRPIPFNFRKYPIISHKLQSLPLHESQTCVHRNTIYCNAVVNSRSDDTTTLGTQCQSSTHRSPGCQHLSTRLLYHHNSITLPHHHRQPSASRAENNNDNSHEPNPTRPCLSPDPRANPNPTKRWTSPDSRAKSSSHSDTSDRLSSGSATSSK